MPPIRVTLPGVSGEFEFIERLTKLLAGPPAGQVWIGDDAAVLDGGQLLATDALVEGVHFDRAFCDLADVGWKALAVNASDIAAMGGTPLAAVAALVTPPGTGLADAVAGGLAQAAEALSCPLVGGDTTGGPALMISVAILGTSPTSGPVLRSGARPGDSIYLTGTLGMAGAALADLRAGRDPAPEALLRLNRPTPRLTEGRAAAAAAATAMIDVSDGLVADLRHICDASGVGATIIDGAVPVTGGTFGESPSVGGDDYELCFTAADPRAVETSFGDAGLTAPARIGLITARADLTLRLADGRDRRLCETGWEHQIG
ncbi:MAG: Thiamine-monophosphate kinase [Acidimicrobiales bacterium]|nr:Thiamine-monophosphate kinase [Acidimicrobiales bacterium]